MNATRLANRILAVIAAMAILLAALAPSMSYALSDAGATRSIWAEICSSAGLKRVKIDTGLQEPIHGEPLNAFEHCPFCQTHGGMLGLPSSASLVLPSYQGNLPLPILFYHAPRSLFAWATPQSRAPPFSL